MESSGVVPTGKRSSRGCGKSWWNSSRLVPRAVQVSSRSCFSVNDHKMSPPCLSTGSPPSGRS